MYLQIRSGMFLSLLLLSVQVVAQDVSDDEELLMGLYGDENIISIATGIQQTISKAPAVASVVTSREIEEMGATDLDEVLEKIPGLHVSRSYLGYNPLYIFRGIHSHYNPQVLVLINGIPITNLFHGDRGQAWGGMGVDGIERIEVIRGPGSAVYGAEAFAGTINIITKTANNIDGTVLKASSGSYGSKGFSVLFGSKHQKFDLALTTEYQSTDGHDALIESDAQTILDSIFGTNASLAPGLINVSRDRLDLRLDLGNANWRLRSGLQRRTNVGIGLGVAEALDPYNRYKSDRLNADLTWNDQVFNEQWDLSAQLSYLDTSQEIERDLIIYPPGVNLGAGPYPDGFIGNPEVLEKHTRFNFTATYSAYSDHTIRIGAGYYLGDLYEVRETKNFGIDPDTGQVLPPGSPLVDVTDTPYVFLQEGNRENNYLFVQDIWQLAADWELTAGVRYDDYSDFGDTSNPRLALVWSTSRRLTTKFLYGEAFRAPSFAETRAINNPIVLGNPLLDPERLKSQEIDFNYLASEDLSLSFNIYKYKWTDIIRFVPDQNASSSTARNTGRRNGQGWEFELNWQASSEFNLEANYAWVKTEDVDAGNTQVAFAPHQQAYLGALWTINDSASLVSQIHHIMDRAREPGDSRSEVDDYTIAIMALKYKFLKGLDLQLVVNNLLDEDAREPSIWSNPANIPNDLPLADRSFLVKLTFEL